MMKPKEIDNLHLSLSRFRENVRLYKMFKCLECVELFYHTGHQSNRHSSSTDVVQVVRRALVETKASELRTYCESMLARGIDVTSELPEELR